MAHPVTTPANSGQLKKSPINPDFHYDALDQAAAQIRLLKLLPRSENDPHIKCEFLPPVAPSEAPAYEALSYMWGDVKCLRTIQLDARDFNVTQNLLDALTALQHADASRTLWVDAICINQDDDADKNYQVPLMGEIYKRATRVNIWLGPEDPGAPSAFDVLEQSTINEEGLLCPPSRKPDTLSGWKPSPDDDSLLHALCDLCHRPYWSRVWILQEVILARDAWVYSGTRQARLAILRKHISYLRNYTDLSRLILLERIFKASNIHEGSRVLSRICLSQCATILRSGSTGLYRRSLIDLLEDYWQSSCADPRDKVYGLLSLAKDVSRTNMIPIRYGQPLALVYLDVLQFAHTRSWGADWSKMARLSDLLQKALGPGSHEIHRGFSDMIHPQAGTPGFIANVPTTVLARAPFPVCKLFSSLGDHYGLGADASRLTEGILLPVDKGREEQRTLGFYQQRPWRTLHTLDCVRDGERVVFRRDTRAPRDDQPTNTDRTQPLLESVLDSDARDPRAILAISPQEQSPDDYIRNGDRIAFGRTVWDMIESQPTTPGPGPPEPNEVLLWAWGKALDLAVRRPPPKLDIAQLELPHADALPAEVVATSWNRYRFFVASKAGRLVRGIITDKAAEGDCISWLIGSYSAVVLRPEGDDGYLLIGRAVVAIADRDWEFPHNEKPTLQCGEVPLSVFQLVTNEIGYVDDVFRGFS